MENMSQETLGSAAACTYGEKLAPGLCKADMLCSSDREMMHEFSSLCMRRLNGHLPLRLFLSFLQNFVEANVDKEIQKNRLVIIHSASEFERGTHRTAVDVHGLFEMTKRVDHEFVSKLATPLFAMAIRHDHIEAVRKKRIAALLNMVFDLLSNWRDSSPLHSIVQSTFSEQEFRELLGNVLRLYTLETRMLGDSITIHGPAGKAKDLLAGKLFSTMEKTAEEVSVMYARRVFSAAG